MSPDCVYPRCGQTAFTHGVGSWTGWVILSHAYQHDALYPCRVVYLQGFGGRKCWSGGQTLVILRSQFDISFRVKGKLKDCVSFLLPLFWYPKTPECYFLLDGLVFWWSESIRAKYLDPDMWNVGDFRKRTGGSVTWNHGGSRIGHGTQWPGHRTQWPSNEALRGSRVRTDREGGTPCGVAGNNWYNAIVVLEDILQTKWNALCLEHSNTTKIYSTPVV